MTAFGFNLDHIVIVVPSLASSIKAFTSLGFTVTPGGDNGPSHNALVVFADGTYIELLSLRSSVKRMAFRFLGFSKLVYLFKPLVSELSFRFILWFAGPYGIRDWCIKLGSSDLLACTTNSKVELTLRQKFRRRNHKANSIEWFLCAPKDRRLPFMIEDISDSSERIPSDENVRHTNTVVGVNRILLNRHFYSSLAKDLRQLDQALSNANGDSSRLELSVVDMQEGQLAIELVDEHDKLVMLTVSDQNIAELSAV